MGVLWDGCVYCTVISVMLVLGLFYDPLQRLIFCDESPISLMKS